MYSTGNMHAATAKQNEVLEVILRHVQANNIHVGERVPSIRRLSVETGLAQATVAKAVKELARRGYIESRSRVGTVLRKELVAPGTERVLRIINVSFINNRNNTSHSTGEQGYWVRQAIKRRLPGAELSTTWFTDNDDASAIENMLDYHYLMRSRPKNVVFLLNATPRWVKQRFQERGIPAIIYGGREEGIDIPNLTIDSNLVVRQTMQTVGQAGQLPVMLLVDAEEDIGEQKRYVQRFEELAERSGGDVSVVRVSASVDVLRGQLTKIVTAPRSPRTFIVKNAEEGARAMGILNELGIRVPEQLGIICLASGTLAEFVVPALTGFQSDPNACGDALSDLITERVEGHDIRGKTVLNDMVLVFRGSFPNPLLAGSTPHGTAGRDRRA